VIRPGEHPLAALGDALEDRPGRTLLAIDQFEEVFTACADLGERVRFLDAITQAAGADDDVTVALAMRADFYGRCAEHRALGSLIAGNQILVGPMDAEELRRTIELPAVRAGLSVEPDLIDALVSDTVGQPGALPLLSTALLELWTRRRDGVLRLEDYLRSGGVEGAVARLAEDAFGRLDDEQQAAAKRILLRLAAPGEGADVVGRQAPLAEFDLDRDGSAARAMAVLADARLITVSEGTVEVAHEALLREWPRLRTWLAEDTEGRALHRHITEATRAWDDGGRDGADLYRGARLTAAWDWAGVHDADLNELERQFLTSSHTASEGEAVRSKRTNRRLRGLLVGVALLLVASLVIGDLALTQRDRATDALTVADAGRLASGSRLEPDPQLALLMAREAVNISDSAETRSALFAALERSPAITDRMYAPGGPSPAGDETQWIDGSADGSMLAIGDAGPSVTFFDTARREAIGSIDVGSGTERAAFSPDGNTLAVVTSAGDLVALDVATQTVRDRVPVSDTVDALVFDPDGTRLVTAEHGQDLREVLVPRDPVTLRSTGRSIRTPGHDRATFPEISRPLALFAMTFTPDGSALVTTRQHGPTLLWKPDLTVARRYPVGGQGIAIGPDGRTAALIENDDGSITGSVWFLDLRTGDVRRGSAGHSGTFKTEYEAVGVAFVRGGRSVVTVGNDSRLLVWDVDSASVDMNLAETGDLPLRGPVLSPDGATAYTTDRNGDVVVWDISGRRRLDRPFTAGRGFPQWPWFAMSSDGRLIAVPSSPGAHFGKEGTVSVIDLGTLRTIRSIPYPHGSPEAVAFSPDGSTLAVTSVTNGRDRGDARLWDLPTGRPSATLRGIPGGQRLVAVRFSPDGQLLVGGGTARSGGTVIVWTPRSSEQPATRFRTHRTVEDVAFTPDGSQLVISTGWGDGGDYVLWDTRSKDMVGSVRADDAAVFTSAVSPDGHTVMSGGQTGAVRLWDLSTGTLLGSLNGLTGSAASVGFTPDGRTAVASDTSGNVLLWDVPSRSTIGDPLPGPTSDGVAAATLTPDGRRLVVVSDSGAGWVWNVDPADWLTRACAVAGRNFTQPEWEKFLPDRAYQPTCGS